MSDGQLQTSGSGEIPVGANILKNRAVRAADSVCQIEIAGNPMGTGFLVGPDVVLTNYHVVEKALQGREFARQVRCRFDFAETEAGGVAPGFITDVTSPILDFSAYGQGEALGKPSDPLPELDQLDYALLKLADAVGNKPAPGAWNKRGWITLKPDVWPIDKDASLNIIQHPLTGPKVTIRSDKGSASLNAPKNRLRYATVAHHGSSGSPCLTADWELVALHHYGDPAWVLDSKRQGIPIWLILESILKKDDLASSVPAYRDDANVVGSFLAALTAVAHDGEIGAKISTWRTAIEKAKDAVLRLKTFKGLHDFLHRCQRQLPALLMAVGSKDQATALAQLAEYGRILLDELPQPRDYAGNLRDEGHGERDFHLAWIAKIELAGETLRDLETRPAGTPADALTPIVQIRKEIRLRLPKINEQLVSEAANLPLDPVVTAFHDFATAKALTETTKADGPLALEQLRDRLHSRVREHDLWQEVENQLWFLEDGVASDAGVNRQLFVEHWKEVWKGVQELCAQDSQAKWARDMTGSGTALHGLLGANNWPTVGRAFDDFRGKTIKRFSGVDTVLLKQCEEIVVIADPLATLLGAEP